MSTDVDVIVVGGRCAGAPLATLLARGGARVRLLDKARFPSDTPSTHIVQPRGADVLDRLGLGDALRDAGAADITGLVLQYDDARVDVDYADAGDALSTGTRPGLSLRRSALDALLLDAARAAGVDVRTSTAVTAVVRDERGRVVGVRTGDGDLGARLVVGADGRGSAIAGFVGAEEYATYPAPRLASWAYLRGTDGDRGRLRIGRFGTTALISVPAEDGLHLVGVVPPVQRRAEFLADRDACFAAEVARWPELASFVGGARREGPLRVVPDWRAYLRRSAGPGWALVGDAGNFKDPSAAQGITDALRQAEHLADAVLAALPGDDADLDAATGRWWRWRDHDCRDMHWFARDMGAAGATGPVLTELVRRLAREDRGVVFAQLLNRDVRSGEIVTPARTARAVLDALRTPSRSAVPAELAAVAAARWTRLVRDRHRLVRAAA